MISSTAAPYLVAGTVAATTILGVGFNLALLWLVRRERRNCEEAILRLDAASDRFDGAYVRAQLTRLYNQHAEETR